MPEIAPTLHSIMQIHLEILERFGIHHVEHGIIKRGCLLSLANSHLEWARKYKEEQLFKIDPIRRYALSTPFETIPWEFMSLRNKEEAYTLGLRRKLCSVSRGILISLKTFGRHETFVFGSGDKRFNFYQIWQSHHQELLSIMNAIGKGHKSLNQSSALTKQMEHVA